MLMKMGMMAGSMSGKLGTHVMSHNKGGHYARMNSLNVNPATPEQQVMRDALSALSTRWRDVVTPAQRDQWTAYTAGSPYTNRLGESKIMPPLSMYIRCNAPRLQAGLVIADDGPIINGDGTLTPPTVATWTAHADNTGNGPGGIAWTLGDTWNPTTMETDSALMMFISRPQNPTVVFFKGPYRLANVIGAGHTNPFTTALDSFPAGSGQKKFFRFVASCKDGRLTNVVEGSFTLA